MHFNLRNKWLCASQKGLAADWQRSDRQLNVCPGIDLQVICELHHLHLVPVPQRLFTAILDWIALLALSPLGVAVSLLPKLADVNGEFRRVCVPSEEPLILENVRRILGCVVPLLAVVLPTGESRAGLVLAVDPVAMTYQLTGTTEFTPFFGDDSDFGQWRIESGGSPGALTSFDTTFATATPDGLALTRLRLFDTATDLIVDWGVSGVGQQQVFGNGQIISYAGASVTQKAYFESIIGQSLTPNPGFSAELIAVVNVPEPTSLALLGLGGLVMLLRNRRQRVGSELRCSLASQFFIRPGDFQIRLQVSGSRLEEAVLFPAED